MLGKKIGKRAMLLGALAQSLPDIDFIAALWNDTSSNLLAHRGFTHSILFDILCTVGFALLAEHFHRSHRVGFRRWVLFFAVQISVHLLIDTYNNYGVGLLEPFSHQRIAFNALFVADPFFSVWPAIAFVALLILPAYVRKRTFWWRFGLTASAIYLFYCTLNKLKIQNDVKEILQNQKIASKEYLTTPTPLNNWLWYVVAKSDSGFHVGFRSMFDRKKEIDFEYFPQNHQLLKGVTDHEELQRLIRFSQGYYTAEKWSDTLVFNDLRFGQIIGWHNPRERFVFHYFLEEPDNTNRLVVQRGRFAKWNIESTKTLIRRIAGN